jgi:hypothetical protein
MVAAAAFADVGLAEITVAGFDAKDWDVSDVLTKPPCACGLVEITLAAVGKPAEVPREICED